MCLFHNHLLLELPSPCPYFASVVTPAMFPLALEYQQLMLQEHCLDLEVQDLCLNLVFHVVPQTGRGQRDVEGVGVQPGLMLPLAVPTCLTVRYCLSESAVISVWYHQQLPIQNNKRNKGKQEGEEDTS